MEEKLAPLCKDCAHCNILPRTFYQGNYLCYKDAKAIRNLVTGEITYITRECISQRSGNGVSDVFCSERGDFFKPKEATK